MPYAAMSPRPPPFALTRRGAALALAQVLDVPLCRYAPDFSRTYLWPRARGHVLVLKPQARGPLRTSRTSRPHF